DGVISVGGIHRADDGTLTASNYTSAYSIAALHDQPIERTVDLKALGKHAADAQDGRCSKCGEALLDKSCAVCRQAVHNVEGQFVVKEGTDVVHPWCDSVYPDRQKQKQIEQLVKAQVPDIGA